jgi:hypothetical protein
VQRDRRKLGAVARRLPPRRGRYTRDANERRRKDLPDIAAGQVLVALLHGFGMSPEEEIRSIVLQF